MMHKPDMVSETFALTGVRCASCVLKIERNLAALPGVELARGNATQKRIRLVWEDGAQSIDSLIGSITSLGYDANRIATDIPDTVEVSLLPRLAVAAFGAMNVMALSMAVWFGAISDMGAGTMQFLHWLSALIALPVVLYSGAVFHDNALRALRVGRMTMDSPITLAIWITFAASLIGTWQGASHIYFDAVVSLIFLLLIGRVLEQSMRKRSGDAAGNLRKLLDVTATRLTDCGAQSIAAEDLAPGDLILVQTGERIPADGRLTSSLAELDESALTGETLPRHVTKGEAVAAGTLLCAGPAELRVTHVGAASQLGQMAQLVDDVTAHKGRLQQLSDQFAQGYIPLVMGGGGFGFLLWFFVFGANAAEATMIAVAVLIVTCPCAAGLATPAVTSRAVQLAMHAGVVIKSGRALETLGDVDHIYLDKTGTASDPVLKPSDAVPTSVLLAARELAAGSNHPLAQALMAGANQPPDGELVEHVAAGMQAPSGARLGSAAFAGANDPDIKWPTLWYRDPVGAITPIQFDEVPRADLQPFLAACENLGISIAIQSGDTAPAVSRFADAVGIKVWFAAQTPEAKLARIKTDEIQGRTAMMIGDGINDSPALGGASVSVSFAGATQIAQSSADIVLTQPKLDLLPDAIRLARKSRHLIRQNLTFASIYNVVTVPLALAGTLTPAIAAALMSASSLVVIANGLRLRTLR